METAPPWVAGLWRGGERNEGVALETMADGDAAAAFAAGLVFGGSSGGTGGVELRVSCDLSCVSCYQCSACHRNAAMVMRLPTAAMPSRMRCILSSLFSRSFSLARSRMSWPRSLR